MTLFFENGVVNRKDLLFPVCFLLGSSLLAGPYLIALHSVYGNWTMSPMSEAPKGGVKEVIDYGRKNGARFILFDTNSVLSRRQELKELLEPLEGKFINPAYGIEVFKTNYFPDLGGYVIYRYKQ